ncbi:MAG: Rap1a/Tai family immunity protein [Proteobacteria bacterium]|nr:Rap1a/Tai family immunity protein [Pseudomonadota bacterium]
MMKTFIIALLWQMATPSAATPKAFISGAELLRLCESAASSNFSRATDCLGYISGLSDTHEAFVDLNTFKPQWCWPAEGVSNRQMAIVVKDYLEYNAALLDKSAALLASIAFFEAYPCSGR